MATDQKKELFHTECSLQTDQEYSLEELIKECNDHFERIRDQHKPWLESEKSELTRFTIYSNYENSYYGSCSAEFKIKIYRTETDKEFNNRINSVRAYEEAEKRKREAKEAKELTKRLEQERLMKDKDYQQFLKLKEKFKQ